VYLTYFYRFGYLCAKNYQIWWRFDEILTKTGWVIFWHTLCVTTMCLFVGSVTGLRLFFASCGLRWKWSLPGLLRFKSSDDLSHDLNQQ